MPFFLCCDNLDVLSLIAFCVLFFALMQKHYECLYIVDVHDASQNWFAMHFTTKFINMSLEVSFLPLTTN